MDDDTKLKIILGIILALAIVIIIGLWEVLVKPLFGFLAGGISF
ncbi:MAG: hypothetical protein AAB358_00925 [Patescibacteria group bacterium]